MENFEEEKRSSELIKKLQKFLDTYSGPDDQLPRAMGDYLEEIAATNKIKPGETYAAIATAIFPEIGQLIGMVKVLDLVNEDGSEEQRPNTIVIFRTVGLSTKVFQMGLIRFKKGFNKI